MRDDEWLEDCEVVAEGDDDDDKVTLILCDESELGDPVLVIDGEFDSLLEWHVVPLARIEPDDEWHEEGEVLSELDADNDVVSLGLRDRSVLEELDVVTDGE